MLTLSVLFAMEHSPAAPHPWATKITLDAAALPDDIDNSVTMMTPSRTDNLKTNQTQMQMRVLTRMRIPTQMQIPTSKSSG